MTSYLLTALCSHDVHHPRTPRKPNKKKGLLVDPVDPSVPRNARYGEKSVGTNGNRSQLMTMRPSNPRASPHYYHPCTLPSGLLPPHTCFSPSPFEDHRTCSLLPSVNIFWIMTPPPPRLLYTVLHHVRRIFRSVRSHVTFQLSDDPQHRGRSTSV